jgi:hypothetical protein
MPTHNRFDSSFNNENNDIKAQDNNRHSRHSNYRDNCKGVNEEEREEKGLTNSICNNIKDNEQYQQLDKRTLDPNIDCNEVISLIKQITNSIRKVLDNNLVVVSFQLPQQHKSNAYDKILLPRFDKCIEVIRNNSKSKINLLDVKVYNNNNKDSSKLLVLEERDVQ